MHNYQQGPLFKRLRIRLFGLTARERADNLAQAASITAAAILENAEEDRLLDEFADRHPELMAEPFSVWLPRFQAYIAARS